MPSTFASAAASQSDNSTRRASGRADSSDWSRRPNGATQTFRRPSFALAGASQSSQRDISNTSHTTPISSGTYQPPHVTNRNGMPASTRYSREQLLGLYREQKDVGELTDDIKDLFIGEFDVDQHEAHGIDTASYPAVCLNLAADTEPLGLVEMTLEEVEHFTTTVNSPLKAPNQNNTASQREGSGLRKTSLSHTQSLANNSTPFSARNSNRRDKSDSHAWPRDSMMSPGANRTGGEDAAFDPPPSLARRNTESKESEFGRFSEDRDRDGRGHNAKSSFGPLRRVSTGPMSAGVGGPPSPWSQAPGSAFGAFGATNGSTAQSSRPGGGLARGESRFKGLMRRDSAIENEPHLRERPSHASLERFSETGGDHVSSRSGDGFDRVGPEDSAGRVQDTRYGERSNFDTRESRPEFGDQRRASRPTFSGHARMSGFPGADDDAAYQSWIEQHPGAQQNAHQVRPSDDEPLSPTFTNPYQSPKRPTANASSVDANGLDFESFHLPGLGSLKEDIMGTPTSAAPSYGRTSSSYDTRSFDLGTTTTSASSRAFPGLAGLAGLAPVGHATNRGPGLASGTPSRERMLHSSSELQSRSDVLQGSGLAGLGNMGAFGMTSPSDRTPGAGRGRLGSLFPTDMQDQMLPDLGPGRQRRGPAGNLEESRDSYASFGNKPPGQAFASGLNATRGTEPSSSFGFGRYEEASNDPGDTGLAAQSPYPLDAISQVAQPIGSHTNHAQSQQGLDQMQQQPPLSAGNAGAQPPAAQQKQMVMPDRIRWIYRDPQGNTQGPWSGLEMHDWYRAGFFSPELLVKKAEDADYEPLAQLIRRIGNSREPFLVPQIGIPGPPSTTTPNTWTPQVAAPTNAPSTAPAAQPPFASSFPSFGTTLTAEQQNALERRKQEEQYLMARQKEHLAQQQVLVKQMQMQSPHGAHQQPLQHHSSAHSLQSQPSYGSITSPGGYQSAHLAGPGSVQPGGFDSMNRSGAAGLGSGLDALGDIEEEALTTEFGRINVSASHLSRYTDSQHHGAQPPGHLSDDERIQAMVRDRALLQNEQARYRPDEQKGQMGDNGRLQQFYDLRQASSEHAHSLDHHSGSVAEDSLHQQVTYQGGKHVVPEDVDPRSFPAKLATRQQKPQNLTLTEQVQQAAKESPATPTHSPWAKVDRPITESHPVSQTSSPLPAPAARRSGGQSVVDALAAGSSPSHASPSTESTNISVAPWAKESADATKQPSLKEIQEAEARRAAKQEEIQAAMRRAAREREVIAQPVAPAPGLPSTSSWASGDGLSSPSVSGPSAWAKATSSKPAVGAASAKNTLAQIQKEEEASRRRALAAATSAKNNAVTNAAAIAIPAGKRYADLAGGSVAQAPPGIVASAWTTVGASGKPKTPATPTFPTAGPRTASVDATSNIAAAPKMKPAVAPLRTNVSAGFNAQDDFKKWAVNELRPDLKKGIQVDDFVSSLYSLPTDTDLITEAVYSSSSTMDSRHFAEEFVRRRTLADKNKPQPPSGGASAPVNRSAGESKGAGGWNEVARKGPVSAAKEESNAFKVVPSKKKGGKK